MVSPFSSSGPCPDCSWNSFKINVPFLDRSIPTFEAERAFMAGTTYEDLAEAMVVEKLIFNINIILILVFKKTTFRGFFMCFFSP